MHRAKADAEAGQPRPLAECSQHHKVGVFLQHGNAGRPAELVVGFVDNHHQAGVQERPDFGLGGDVAAGVVGAGEDNGLGVGRYRQLDGFDVDLEVLVPRYGDRLTPAEARVKRVHAKGRGGGDNVVAGTDEHPEQKVDELIAAVARHDAVGSYVDVTRQHPAQLPLVRVGVVIVVLEIGQSFGDPRRGTVGVFVSVQPDDLFRRNTRPLRHDLHGVHAVIGLYAPYVWKHRVFDSG